MPEPDELDIDWEGEPRMRPTIRTVLDPVEVEGAADGSGSSTMGPGGRIVFGDEVDADAPIDDVPKGPAEAPSAEMGARLEADAQGRAERRRRIAAAQEVTPTGIVDGAAGPLWDLLVAGGSMQTPGQQSPAERRTSERAHQLWDQLTSSDARLGGRNTIDPIVGEDLRGEAPAAGFADTALLGMGDEAAGGVAALTGGDYRETRDRARSRARRAAEQAPATHAIGQVAGSLPLMAIPGASATSASLLPRLAMAAGQGAQLGGMAAFGGSEHELLGEDAAPERLAEDTAQGALAGGGMGLLGELAGSAMGAARHGPTPNPRGRDEALLAATGGSGGSIGPGTVERFDFGDTHDAIMRSRARAAQVLRDTRAVPPIAGVTGTRESIERALGGVTGTMDDVRTAMGTRGPTGAEIAQRLRDRATSTTSPTAGARRALLEDFAERYGGVPDSAGVPQPQPGMRSPSEPIDYNALMEDLGNLRDAGSHRTRAGLDVNLRERGLRGVDRELRDAYDDAIERELSGAQGGGYRGADVSPEQMAARERIGPDPVAAYRQARQRYPVLDTALSNARQGEARMAQNRGIGMSEMLWGGHGAGIGAAIGGAPGAIAGGALGAGAARGWRAIEPRVRATGAQFMHDVAQQYPRDMMRRLPLEQAEELARLVGPRASPFMQALGRDASPPEESPSVDEPTVTQPEDDELDIEWEEEEP